MTDGPFRNSELPANWKRYGKELVNDATSPAERTARACRNMLTDAGVEKVSRVVGTLEARAGNAQLDLDPASSVAAVFDAHPKTDTLDSLQRHINANLRDNVPFDAAVDRAVKSMITDMVRTTKNRMDEECIRARDLRDMTAADYAKGLARNRETFAAVNIDALGDALVSGDKNAFKVDVQRKTNLDDGPE